MRGERYEFEIKSAPTDNPSSNPAYVAVALSTDNKMGDDSAMECVPENGQIRAYTSWTLPRPSPGVTRQGVVSKLNEIAIRLLRIEINSNECFFIFFGYFSLKTLLDFWMHHIMMVLFIVVLCVNHDRMSSAENSI